MARERQAVDKVVSRKLPGFAQLGAGHGQWRSPAGPAHWTLEPDADRFWLLLLGPAIANLACGDLSRMAKDFRHRADGPGRSRSYGGTRTTAGHGAAKYGLTDAWKTMCASSSCWIVCTAGWLVIVDAAVARGRESDAPRSIDAGARMLFEAFADELRQTRSGFRLSLPDRSA